MNWYMIPVAAVAAVLIGWLWYSPMLFQKPWQKGTGITSAAAKKGMLIALLGHLVLSLVLAYGVQCLADKLHKSGYLEGMKLGLKVGVLFVLPCTSIGYLYQKKSIQLWLIDTGYLLLSLVAMGALVAFK